MNADAAEVKVQIHLSTRDVNLQIAEEPTTLLVQTCEQFPLSHGPVHAIKYHLLRLRASFDPT